MNRTVINANPSKSVRNVNHEFFDLHMQSVFIPLSPQEEDLFLRMVLSEEKAKQRKLTYDELLGIAENCSS